MFNSLSNDPDAVGEFLRDQFFVQWENGKRKGTGCYSTFELQPDVTVLPKEPVDDDPDMYYDVALKNVQGEQIKMRYYWDGDGLLQFIFEDGVVLENDDCKKDYGWEWSS